MILWWLICFCLCYRHWIVLCWKLNQTTQYDIKILQKKIDYHLWKWYSVAYFWLNILSSRHTYFMLIFYRISVFLFITCLLKVVCYFGLADISYSLSNQMIEKKTVRKWIYFRDDNNKVLQSQSNKIRLPSV